MSYFYALAAALNTFMAIYNGMNGGAPGMVALSAAAATFLAIAAIRKITEKQQ